MSDDKMAVTVQILDKDYRIACSAEEQHGLMDCARMLDQRMREVRQNGRVIGADRIAVMAALNLVYELMRQRDNGSVDVERLGQLQQRVSAAVQGSGEAAAGGAAPGHNEGHKAALKSGPTTGVDVPEESV